MRTKQELQEIGFNPDIFIEAYAPSFFWNKKSDSFAIDSDDLDAELVPHVCKSIVFSNIDSEKLKEIASSKLVAFFPCDDPSISNDNLKRKLLMFSIVKP